MEAEPEPMEAYMASQAHTARAFGRIGVLVIGLVEGEDGDCAALELQGALKNAHKAWADARNPLWS